MRITLAIVLGVVVIMLCGTLAIVVTDLLIRVVLLVCSLTMAFLTGLRVGEHSRAPFNRDVMRVNRLLDEQNQDLCEANLRMLRDAAKSKHEPVEGRGFRSIPCSETNDDVGARPKRLRGA